MQICFYSIQASSRISPQSQMYRKGFVGWGEWPNRVRTMQLQFEELIDSLWHQKDNIKIVAYAYMRQTYSSKILWIYMRIYHTLCPPILQL